MSDQQSETRHGAPANSQSDTADDGATSTDGNSDDDPFSDMDSWVTMKDLLKARFGEDYFETEDTS